jgi:predicted MPP superfamily phosphohydrolase
MVFEWFVLAVAAVGHACVIVSLMNFIHGYGLAEKWVDRLTLVLLAAGACTCAGVLWGAWGLAWRAWPFPVQAYVAACLVVALVALPVTTFILRFRREPDGIVGRAKETDLATPTDGDSFIGEGRHAWMLRLPGAVGLRLRQVEWEIEIPDLPAAIDGLSLVQVSDLHFAPCYRRRYFEAVLDNAVGWDADLVVFTGDLIDHESTIAWIEPVMSRLRGRLGTYAILGNHDLSFGVARISGELRRAGFEDLEGRWTTLDVAGSTVAIGGTSAPWGKALDLGGQGDADVRMLLSHTPDLFYRAAAHRIDLMLSGHNHGGQIRLPIVGPVAMPSRYSRRFDRGFFRKGQTLMYVSQGVGAKHPVRYGCTPEITRLVLRVPRHQSHGRRPVLHSGSGRFQGV